MSGFALALAQFDQQLPDAAGGPQFASDVRGEPQIALSVEPTCFYLGRQFAHRLGKGEKDLFDLTRFETPFSGHARHLLSLPPVYTRTLRRDRRAPAIAGARRRAGRPGELGRGRPVRAVSGGW